MASSTSPDSVQFKDLQISVVVKRNGAKGKSFEETIYPLKGVSGMFEAGKLSCIIGPSGCGKTTLLNVLAGRARGSKTGRSTMSGKVCLSGSEIDPVAERRRCAYVMADDTMYGTLTPREAIRFSAQMRLPGASTSDQEAKVARLLTELGITQCADTLIGNRLIKGISSGEKKRTAVALELVGDPKLILLDEPTSGLDSYMAYKLVETLKKLADSGHTVICTIHQPRSEIFHLFDSVMFLSRGQIVYNGQVKETTSYFGQRGHECPKTHNPADYVMMLLQTLSQDALAKLASEYQARTNTELEGVVAGDRKEPPSPKGGYSSLSKEHMGTVSAAKIKNLLKRELINVARNKPVLQNRFGATIFMAVLIALVFSNVAKNPNQLDSAVVQNMIGAVTLLVMNGMFANAQPVLISYPLELPAFMREYSAGYYSATQYLVCKTIVDIPLLLVQSLVFTCITFLSMGFASGYGYILMAHFFLGIAANAIAMSLATGMKSVKAAIEMAPVIFVPQLMFSGVFVTIQQIPSWLNWIQYIVALKYAVNIAYIGTLDGFIFSPSLFTKNSVNDTLLWMYILILLALAVAFRLLSLFFLYIRGRDTVF